MHLYAALLDGSHIVIEARPSGELTHFRGTRVVDERVQVVPLFCCTHAMGCVRVHNLTLVAFVLRVQVIPPPLCAHAMGNV